MSCCVKDPSLTGNAALAPATFWRPTEKIISKRFPLPNEKKQEEELISHRLLEKNLQLADLIDIALLLNPSTAQTWANARAAAYQVEINRAPLYPNINLEEELLFSDARWDDGAPFIATNSTNTTCASTTHLMGLDNFYFPALFQAKKSSHAHFFELLKAKGKTSFLAAYQKKQKQIAVDDTQKTTVSPPFIAGNTSESMGSTRMLTHTLTLSYLLLDFGGRNAAIEAAKQALFYSNWTHNRQIQQVMIDVLQTYYQHIGIIYLLQARYSDLENAKKNYESAAAQFEAGVRSQVDVLQAKTELIQIELTLSDLIGQKQITHANLANAMGLSADTEFFLPDIAHDIDFSFVQQNIEALIEKAKAMRPDFAAAYAIYQQRLQQIIVARSAGLPTLGTFIQMQEFNDLKNSSFNNHAIEGSFTVSVPLFNGFLYVNQERQAAELAKAALANVNTVELNISLDVMTSYTNIQTAAKNIRYSDEYVVTSEKAYQAAFFTYQEGISTILDVLSAQRALANARSQKIQARTQWAIAVANLSFAMGILGIDDIEDKAILYGKKPYAS